MAVNPLPPQAFTKDTLQKAYAWLLTQNSSIKEMANTQDMLISLYLKAQRGGEAALDTPSIQNFKQELKSLANLMGDLQTPATTPSTQQQQAPYTAAAQPQPPPTHHTHHAYHAPSAVTYATTHMATQTAAVIQPTASHVSAAVQQPPKNDSSVFTATLSQLDGNSLNMLSEVRNTLNLSSDIEALRALMALGYKQFKKI